MYHMAAEFQKYIKSTFLVDGKQNKSAVIHRAFSQHIITHLKGASSAEEDKAFRHFVKNTFNTQVHKTVKHTPYKLVFGQSPSSLLVPDATLKGMMNEEDIEDPNRRDEDMDDDINPTYGRTMT